MDTQYPPSDFKTKSVTCLEIEKVYEVNESVACTSPKALAGELDEFKFKNQEHFIVFSLNSKHNLIARRVVIIGLLNSAPIHPREVFSDPLKDRAAAIILAHNHPSGDIQPSADDISVTKRIREAGDILGIRVVDHIIVGRDGLYSFVDSGLIH